MYNIITAELGITKLVPQMLTEALKQTRTENLQ